MAQASTVGDATRRFCGGTSSWSGASTSGTLSNIMSGAWLTAGSSTETEAGAPVDRCRAGPRDAPASRVLGGLQLPRAAPSRLGGTGDRSSEGLRARA